MFCRYVLPEQLADPPTSVFSKIYNKNDLLVNSSMTPSTSPPNSSWNDNFLFSVMTKLTFPNRSVQGNHILIATQNNLVKNSVSDTVAGFRISGGLPPPVSVYTGGLLNVYHVRIVVKRYGQSIAS